MGWFNRQKHRQQRFRQISSHDRSVIFIAEGVLSGQFTEKDYDLQKIYRNHTFEIREINSAKHLSEGFPVSKNATLAILARERRVFESEAFKKFFSLVYYCDPQRKVCRVSRNEIFLTHTIKFGYNLSNGKFIELLYESFNAKLDGYKAEWLCKMLGEFLCNWLDSYPAHFDDARNLIQHPDLLSVSVANKVQWLTRFFNEYLWYARGQRYRDTDPTKKRRLSDG